MINAAADNSNMSFTQDNDDDNKSTTSNDEPSSPKLTRTAASGSSSKSAAAIAAHNIEILNKLVEMGGTSDNDLNNQKRKDFVNKLQKIWEDYSIQCRNIPNISKQPLDLFKLYLIVNEKNGFIEVNKNKMWKEISSALNIGPSASAAFNVRKKYITLGIYH